MGDIHWVKFKDRIGQVQSHMKSHFDSINLNKLLSNKNK